MKLEIHDKMLYNCQLDKNFEDIYIPEDITMIDLGAFCNLKINTLVVPSTVKKIHTGAFSKCKINKVIFNAQQDAAEPIYSIFTECTIQDLCFDSFKVPRDVCYACTITNLYFSDTSRVISPEAFRGCKIKNCNLNQINVIEENSFKNNIFQNTLILPESLKYIGEMAFNNCSFKTIKQLKPFRICHLHAFSANTYNGHSHFIPISETEAEISNIIIDDKIFYKQINNEDNIEVPEGIEIIYDKAFYDCYNISSVKLPSTLKEIGNYAFSTTSIKTINLPESLEKIKDNAFSSSSLKEIDLKNVKEIGDYAFYNAQLEKVIMSNSINKIGYSAFSTNNLKELEIPTVSKLFLARDFIDDDTKLIISKLNFDDNGINLLSHDNIEIKKVTLDELIQAGRSLSEINQIMKSVERSR